MITFDKLGNSVMSFYEFKKSKWLKSAQEVLEIGTTMYSVTNLWIVLGYNFCGEICAPC